MSTQSTHRPTSFLVVGVDGSPQADEALAFALTEAARCGDEVRVVTSWSRVPVTAGLPLVPIPVPPDDVELRAAAQEAQSEAVTRALASAVPGVTVTCQVSEGQPGYVLVEASTDARLLVVGSRALGPVRAALLGSVSRYVARHAECPVAVVPSRHAHGQPTKPPEQAHRDHGAPTVGVMY